MEAIHHQKSTDYRVQWSWKVDLVTQARYEVGIAFASS